MLCWRSMHARPWRFIRNDGLWAHCIRWIIEIILSFCSITTAILLLIFIHLLLRLSALPTHIPIALPQLVLNLLRLVLTSLTRWGKDILSDLLMLLASRLLLRVFLSTWVNIIIICASRLHTIALSFRASVRRQSCAFIHTILFGALRMTILLNISTVLALSLLVGHLSTASKLLTIWRSLEIRVRKTTIWFEIGDWSGLTTRTCHHGPHRLRILISFTSIDRLGGLRHRLLPLHPILICCFQLHDSLLKNFLISHQFLHFKVSILASEILKHLNTFSQIFILIL